MSTVENMWTVAVAALSVTTLACGPDPVTLPEPPQATETAALVATYQMPTANLDASNIQQVATDALVCAIQWLDAHPEVGALAPMARGPDGTPHYLCKRYPAVLDLLLRGFAPGLVRALFRRRVPVEADGTRRGCRGQRREDPRAMTVTLSRRKQ